MVRMIKCNICKASYPSFSKELRSRSWKHPYFKVRYTDGDEDECSLKEILSMLDVDEIRNEKEGGNDEV